MSVYRGIRPDLSDRLEAAGVDVRRQVAYALATVATQRAPAARGREGLLAVADGQFGDSPLRAELEAAALVAEDRYFELSDRREDAEDSGQAFPAELEAELTRARLIARTYQLLVFALDIDANEAAQQSAYTARFVIPAEEADGVVEQILDR